VSHSFIIIYSRFRVVGKFSKITKILQLFVVDVRFANCKLQNVRIGSFCFAEGLGLCALSGSVSAKKKRGKEKF